VTEVGGVAARARSAAFITESGMLFQVSMSLVVEMAP
jgi:hypothetical protein